MLTDKTATNRADSPNPRRGPRETKLSPDGKWKSFSKVPHLLQYVPSGVYFGRVKINGKIRRESLETETFTTAKDKLRDFLSDKRKEASRVVAGTFSVARDEFERAVEADHTLKDASKRYRKNCVKALLRTWPTLDETPPEKISELDCREWAAKFTEEYDDQFFNNTLSTLRSILERAGIPREENPAFKIKRLGVRPKELKLPEPAQFDQILEIIENAGSRFSPHCANLVRFLAFSGCRISEARAVRWSDVDLEKGEIRVQGAKRSKTSGAALFRFVPIIPPMRELLEKLKSAQPRPDDPVCLVGECEKSLTRACTKANVHRITHHDLRHLFATRCIESGLDIPTVSRWLGHADGGALAMRTYGHLRREHSAAMAQKVTFGN